MATGKRGAVVEISAAERQRKALELRRAGASLRAIGDALSCSPATVHGDIRQALAELAAESRAEAEQLRALEVERLDAVMLGHWRAATTGDPDAARIVLRCIEQRTKLLGLAVQPDVPNLGDLLDIVLRWSDGRTIIDVSPSAADDYAAPAAPLPGPGGGAPGPLQGAGGGPEVGKVEVSWGVIPEDGRDRRSGLVGGSDLPAELDGLEGAESLG